MFGYVEIMLLMAVFVLDCVFAVIFGLYVIFLVKINFILVMLIKLRNVDRYGVIRFVGLFLWILLRLVIMMVFLFVIRFFGLFLV